MKAGRKLAVFVLAMVFVLGSVMSVCAADSATADVTVNDDGYFTSKRDDSEIEAVQEELGDALTGKDFVTGVFEVTADDSVEKNENGKYEFTITVPGLTSDTTGVQIAYYNPTTGEWTIIDPKYIDLENGTITIEVDELGLFAVIADDGTVIAASAEGESAEETAGEEEAEESGTGTSPQTGNASTWMLWAAAAVVLLGAAGVVIAKKDRA